MWTRLSPHESAVAVAGLMTGRLEAMTRIAQTHPEGAVLRLPTRRLVVASDPVTVRHVLVDHADRYAKGMGQAESAPWLGDGLLTAEGEPWARQRPSVAALLRARRVQELLPAVVEAARANVAALAQLDGGWVDPRTHLAQYTLDTLSIVFGLAEPDARLVVDAFDTLQDRVMFDTTTLGLVPRWARPLSTRRSLTARATLEREARRILVDTPGQAPWADPVRLIALLLAGYETTASTLAWAVDLLSRRPVVQAALAAEADVVDWDGPLKLDQLELAGAVFRETVRVSPPVWLISRRALVEDVVAGNRVRPGDDVAIVTTAMRGDRSPPFDAAAPQSGRMTEFGQGPRGCPGSALAEAEARIWLALASQALELDSGHGAPPRPVARMSQAPGPFRIRVRPRGARPPVEPTASVAGGRRGTDRQDMP